MYKIHKRSIVLEISLYTQKSDIWWEIENKKRLKPIENLFLLYYLRVSFGFSSFSILNFFPKYQTLN